MTPSGALALREQLRWLERNSKPGDVFTDDWEDAWQDVHRYLSALDDFLEAERERSTDRLHFRAAVAVAADELAEVVAGLAPNAVIRLSLAQIEARSRALEEMLRSAIARNRTPTEPPPGGGR